MMVSVTARPQRVFLLQFLKIYGNTEGNDKDIIIVF